MAIAYGTYDRLPGNVSNEVVEIDLEMMTVRAYGRLIDEMTATQFVVLYALAAKPGRVLTRERIMDMLYGGGNAPVQPRAVDSHVKNIRRKLMKVGLGQLIETVPDVGYRLRPRKPGADAPAPGLARIATPT